MPLLKLFPDMNYINNLKIKRAMQLISNNTKISEWDRAINWYAEKKAEIKGKFDKPGQRIVNDEFIEDHIAGKTDELSNELSMIFG